MRFTCCTFRAQHYLSILFFWYCRYAAAVAGPNGVKIRTSLFKTAFTSMEWLDNKVQETIHPLPNGGLYFFRICTNLSREVIFLRFTEFILVVCKTNFGHVEGVHVAKRHANVSCGIYQSIFGPPKNWGSLSLFINMNGRNRLRTWLFCNNLNQCASF